MAQSAVRHPASAPVNFPYLTYGIILGGALLWCAALLAAPLAASSTGPVHDAGLMLYRFFRPVCHQIDSRSLHLFGGPLGVCARCAAIYFAFLGGALLYPAVRPLSRPVVPSRWFLLSLAVPMLLDVLAGAVGVHDVTLVTRTVTGAVAGGALPFFVIPAAQEAACQLFATPPSTPVHFLKGDLDA